MADPFEVRMRFSSQLEHLNASTTSAVKAAQYALKFKDMDEDLHSCILEQLEKVNTRSSSLRPPLCFPALSVVSRASWYASSKQLIANVCLFAR